MKTKRLKNQLSYRDQQALKVIKPDGRGLEFGALDKPIVSKELFNVKYIDHLPKNELKKKYRNNGFVNLNNLVEVDFVTNNKPLTSVIKNQRFDFIIASHVIEHIPNFIGFINDCFTLLNPGGILSLIIPDKRYSFDIYRRQSTFSDIYSAYIEKRFQPTVRDICDHYFEVVKVSPKDLWSKSKTPVFSKYHSYQEAVRVATQALTESWKIDCHVWIFTYDTFLSLIKQCQFHKLIEFNVKYSCQPILNEMEFFCSLEKPFNVN
jgi:SAM-dependent methyltransferase